MKMGVIYKLTCIANNYYLYGSTLNFNKRLSSYINPLRRGKYKNDILQRCYNKYGEESLKFEIVQKDIPEDILTIVEDIWIGANCSKSNDKKGGMNLRTAYRMFFDDSIKEKISIANKGKKLSKESIEKRSLKRRGIKQAKSSIEKRIEKISNPVLQYDKKGNFIAEYKSYSEAQRITGINKHHIGEVCNNKPKRKAAGKFIWRHKTN